MPCQIREARRSRRYHLARAYAVIGPRRETGATSRLSIGHLVTFEGIAGEMIRPSAFESSLPNDRVPRDQAKIPNVRNWAVRDYGNRIGIWRLMEVLSRYGIRASAALNSEVCDHHPEIIEEGNRLRCEGSS